MLKMEMDTVSDGIEETTNESLVELNSQEIRDEVNRSFGAVGAFGLMTRFATSGAIRLLQNIRDKKQYKIFGHTDFDDFLENNTLAQTYFGSTYRTFNRLEKQMKKEGEEIFDLLNTMKIPMTERKQLGTGDIEMEGDKVFVGGEETSIEDMPMIKSLIKNLASENKDLKKSEEKKIKEIKDVEAKLTQGDADYEEIRRNFDKYKEGDEFDRALGTTINSLIQLNQQAKDLSDADKAKRGENTLDSLWKLITITRNELAQKNFTFQDFTGSTIDGDPVIEKALAKTEDWDD